MALSPAENKLILNLARRHDVEIPELENYDRYYEGTQGLSYMHPEIMREVWPRIRSVIIGWPQLVVDSVEERLRLEGFVTNDEDVDTELWRVWQANRMVLGFRMATVDALVMRRAYVCVGSNADDPDTPYVTPESPLEIFHDEDPITRRVSAALRRVNIVDPVSGGIAERIGTLYLPNETIWLRGDGPAGSFVEERRDQHGLGRVPVVPIVNRARLRATTRTRVGTLAARVGRSDLDPIMPLSDAANKLATDMMVAAEFVATPLRALFGVGPDAFRDEQGNPMTALQAVMGKVLTIPTDEVKAFEFAAGQLANFTEGMREMAQLVASIAGLPPHYLGMSSDNPASADAIAASEARLATRAERKQDALGCGALEVAELILRFTKAWDPEYVSMTPDWRDVRTPTIGAMADAAMKLYQAKIIPLKQTRESLGYSEPEIEAMELEDTQDAAKSPVAQLARGLADQRPADVGAGNQYN